MLSIALLRSEYPHFKFENDFDKYGLLKAGEQHSKNSRDSDQASLRKSILKPMIQVLKKEKAMTPKHKCLHKKVVHFRERYGKMEIEFISLLQEVERTRLHRAFNCSSVFKYAVDIITFSESVAYTYISVARKALEFPELVTSGLTISKASRIVSTINKENASELIAFALKNTMKKIDREVARINPKAGRERVKALSDEFFEVKLSASSEFLEKLERVESLQAQRGLKFGPGAAIEAALDAYLFRHDPVYRAERAMKRKAKRQFDSQNKPHNQASKDTAERETVMAETVMAARAMAETPAAERTPVDTPQSGIRTGTSPRGQELCLNRVRKPLTADQKHTVFMRDKGKCTFEQNGRRCENDRWVDIHHIHEVSRGGSNEPKNLTTLCSFHHGLLH